MEDESDETIIRELWREHLATPFPKGFRGRDVSGVDFVMLDANIAGCVTTYVAGRDLSVYQTAVLGLSYRDAGSVLPVLNEEGKEYFWRLEQLARLVLRATARKNQTT